MDRDRIAVDCAALGQPDLATLDALLRLRLVLRRSGDDIELRNCDPLLRELIRLAGVGEILGCGSSLEAGGETPEGE